MRLPVLMVVFCYVILIVTDLFIIHDFRTMSLYDKYRPLYKKRGKWWIAYTVFAILILAVLTVAICLPRRDMETDVTTTMWLLYIILTVIFAQLVYFIFSILGYIPAIFRKRRWNTGLWIGLPCGVLVFTMMWWGSLVGRNRIETEEITITSPRLPETFNGYKIAQISDLHLGTWGCDTTFIAKLVDHINALHPDLIVFTGDAVNRESHEFKPFIATLSRLKAPDGVLTILGNHDYGDYISWNSPEAKKANLDSLKSYQLQAGWQMIDNTHLAIPNERGDSIIIIGVGNWGEPPFTKYGDLRQAYPDSLLTDNNFKILLSHNPVHWDTEVSKVSNIDLTLAGHTHAMQLMFSIGEWRWSPAQYRYPHWAGLYTDEINAESRLYVNIGAGEVGIPMRIGANPEITLITLRK